MNIHPYSEASAFTRLLLLIATFIHYPGVGAADPLETSPGDHDAMADVLIKMEQTAKALEIECLNYSVHTLRKDLKTLRQYGILDRRMYRWGYYLGTGAMTHTELFLAIQALASQANYQGDPQSRRVYQTLARRLRGIDVNHQGTLAYPVRQHLNRSIVFSDPEEMLDEGNTQNSLFHQLETVETAIYQGQRVELSRGNDLYEQGRVGVVQVYPLQLIYHDVAWYLLCEYANTQHLAIHRVNRFKNYCQVLDVDGRGVDLQQKSLLQGHRLLQEGWGLFLGEPDEQQAELEGRLPLELVKVRFYPPVASFIAEGDRRHPKQQIRNGPKDPVTGQPRYVNYFIKLPPRSLQEFRWWVNRHMEHAEILSPPVLVEQHRQAAQALAARYR
jgi:predicted DNA-binding transcriptional regulator YafY